MDLPTYTNKQKKVIYEKIKLLSTVEQGDIYTLLKQHNLDVEHAFVNDMINDAPNHTFFEDLEESTREKLQLRQVHTLNVEERRVIIEACNGTDLVMQRSICFSKNKNGVMFNLSVVPSSIIARIDTLLQFSETNNQSLDQYDMKLRECKINNDYSTFDTRVVSDDVKTHMEKQSIDTIRMKEWTTYNLDPPSVDKLTQFIEKIVNDGDRFCKKKSCLKFNNAKKRYSKKIWAEPSGRKPEIQERFIELESEQYTFEHVQMPCI